MTFATHQHQLTLVIDQGSHASRIALFANNGGLIYLQSKTIQTHSPDDTIYEQDPLDVLDSINTLLKQIPNDLQKNISLSGLCTQRSSLVAWNTKNGQALCPVISWRDTRNKALTNQLSPFSNKIREISGLPLNAHYCASKIRWLLDNNAEVEQARAENRLCIAPLASYLLFHLLREKPKIIDHSNAQRSQLFDIHNLSWSSELLSLFKIDKNILPKCAPTTHEFGHLKFNNVPLHCVCGDQNAALHAFPNLDNNTALINLGTGGFILSPLNEQKNPHATLLKTLTRSHKQQAYFITEGTVNGAGAALNWAQTVDPCDALFTRLPDWLNEAKQPPVFLNSIAGLGSPWWCDAGDAVFIGNNTHLQSARYVAIIESILFLVLKNLEQLTHSPTTLFISGGLSTLDNLCQKLADLTQANVIRFNETETSARGCAWLAKQIEAENASLWESFQIDKKFIPAENQPIMQRYRQFVGELNKRCIKN